ncbi:ABC transporter ATP-binding protein [Govanella unica]|uniref:ABC transporter ATP-binding protein n=1 Tax=Govanella unica TaxID=2975056 RepID=A0A9X3Z630_9PROT|nr:ABC transporter ATP-binding protein [Govania unica]MDA5192662.1 ABC transporter ATP-binding protein [Govania unica]
MQDFFTPTLGSPSIKTSDLTLTLSSAAGPVDILRGITLTVPEAAAVGIVGPSGSGKSSLMAVLSGLEQATTGSVMVDGTDLVALGEDALARFRRGRIGIVLQSFHLIPTMTAHENVAVPLELAGVEDAFDRAAAELEAVGLSHRLHHYPAQLSGGEQQRVAIARALAPKPQILFADEPTGNLDSATGSAIIDLMFSFHQARHTTMVLVTHDAGLAARCDLILEMADGRIVRESRGRRQRLHEVGGERGLGR